MNNKIQLLANDKILDLRSNICSITNYYELASSSLIALLLLKNVQIVRQKMRIFFCQMFISIAIWNGNNCQLVAERLAIISHWNCISYLIDQFGFWFSYYVMALSQKLKLGYLIKRQFQSFVLDFVPGCVSIMMLLIVSQWYHL